MESHEGNLFSQFERQPHVDLSQWRENIVDYTDSRLGLAEQELHRYLGSSFSPEAHETLMNLVMSHVVRGYVDQLEPAVQPGDKIRAKGNFVYDIYTRSEHELEPGWLEQGSELWGRFQTVSVKDYLDEAILDTATSQITEALVGMHIRRFGAHLVLADPVEVMPDGSRHSIPDCESLFIPLMYRRLNLLLE